MGACMGLPGVCLPQGLQLCTSTELCCTRRCRHCHNAAKCDNEQVQRAGRAAERPTSPHRSHCAVSGVPPSHNLDPRCPCFRIRQRDTLWIGRRCGKWCVHSVTRGSPPPRCACPAAPSLAPTLASSKRNGQRWGPGNVNAASACCVTWLLA